MSIGTRGALTTRLKIFGDKTHIEQIVINRKTPAHDSNRQGITHHTSIQRKQPDHKDDHQRIDEDTLPPTEDAGLHTHNLTEEEAAQGRNSRQEPAGKDQHPTGLIIR